MEAFWQSAGEKYAGANARQWCVEYSMAQVPQTTLQQLQNAVAQPGAEAPSKRLLDMLPPQRLSVVEAPAAVAVRRPRRPSLHLSPHAARQAAGAWASARGAQLADAAAALKQLSGNVAAQVGLSQRMPSAALPLGSKGGSPAQGAYLLNPKPR